MMYYLCFAEQAATDTKLPAANVACTACDFAASLEAVLYDKVRKIMNSRPGLFLNDALPAGTVPRVGQGIWWNVEDDEDYGECGVQIAALFGNILGTTFCDRNGEHSFESIVAQKAF